MLRATPRGRVCEAGGAGARVGPAHEVRQDPRPSICSTRPPRRWGLASPAPAEHPTCCERPRPGSNRRPSPRQGVALPTAPRGLAWVGTWPLRRPLTDSKPLTVAGSRAASFGGWREPEVYASWLRRWRRFLSDLAALTRPATASSFRELVVLALPFGPPPLCCASVPRRGSRPSLARLAASPSRRRPRMSVVGGAGACWLGRPGGTRTRVRGFAGRCLRSTRPQGVGGKWRA